MKIFILFLCFSLVAMPVFAGGCDTSGNSGSGTPRDKAHAAQSRALLENQNKISSDTAKASSQSALDFAKQYMENCLNSLTNVNSSLTSMVGADYAAIAKTIAGGAAYLAMQKACSYAQSQAAEVTNGVRDATSFQYGQASGSIFGFNTPYYSSGGGVTMNSPIIMDTSGNDAGTLNKGTPQGGKFR